MSTNSGLLKVHLNTNSDDVLIVVVCGPFVKLMIKLAWWPRAPLFLTNTDLDKDKGNNTC